jgi:hypothetical protein
MESREAIIKISTVLHTDLNTLEQLKAIKEIMEEYCPCPIKEGFRRLAEDSLWDLDEQREAAIS